MSYEDGMTIYYDPLTKSVVIVFRGETITLKGPFPNIRLGITAGEEFCEDRGWRSDKSTHRGGSVD